MARTLDQILADLNPGYDPQRASIATQQQALQPQFDAQEAGLKAQADQANQGILSQAQERGLGFSGIPVAEQAKYNATTFMPAVAQLKGQQIGAQTSLSDQLNRLNADQRTQALGLQQDEYNRDLENAKLAENRRQFDADLSFKQQEAKRAAASAGSGGVSLGGGGQFGAAAPAQAKIPTFREVLQDQANRGNYESQTLLNYVGNNNRFDGKVKSREAFDILKRNGVQGNYYV